MIEIYSQVVDEKQWENVNINAMANTAIELINDYHNIKDDKEISVVFTNNNKVQELNKMYRGKDKSTNILSFAFNDDGTDGNMLGELFLAYDVISDEAKEQGKGLEDHLLHILLHGILHLLGYDHEKDSDAEEMEKLEAELLNKKNIENPY